MISTAASGQGEQHHDLVRRWRIGKRHVAIGDRVAALASGAFAEQVVVHATRLVRVPDAMSFRDASAFVVVYGTALRALKTCAQLKPGEVLLVLGGAGGVGLAAIEVGLMSTFGPMWISNN
jgi:NADPH2:quinone reductase